MTPFDADDDEAFDEWIRELDEDVIQGEFGYESGEFTAYPSLWRPSFDEGLTPRAAFERSLDAYANARDARDAEQKQRYARIIETDAASLLRERRASLRDLCFPSRPTAACSRSPICTTSSNSSIFVYIRTLSLKYASTLRRCSN